MDVLILAGGKCKKDLVDETGVEWRCDLQIDGRTFLDITLEAVQGLGRIILVGPEPLPGLEHVLPGRSFVQSLEGGIKRVTSSDVLIVTADMAWINSAAVRGFLDRCPSGADIGYPIVPLEDCERRYPGLSRTSVGLKEGKFTGGNLVWAKTDALKKAIGVLEKAYEARKSPVSLARIVGIDLLFRLALSKASPQTLSVEWVEKRLSRFLGSQARAVVCPFPEIGADIDSADQYRIMTELQISAN